MFSERPIRAGWMIDGSGGRVQKNVLIRIKDGFFQGIRSFPTGEMKPSAFSDLSGCTILPALADAHVHLIMSGTPDQDRRKQQLNERFQQVRETISFHLKQWVAHGVLAVRDGGIYWFWILIHEYVLVLSFAERSLYSLFEVFLIY